MELQYCKHCGKNEKTEMNASEEVGVPFSETFQLRSREPFIFYIWRMPFQLSTKVCLPHFIVIPLFKSQIICRQTISLEKI